MIIVVKVPFGIQTNTKQTVIFLKELYLSHLYANHYPNRLMNSHFLIVLTLSHPTLNERY